MSWQEQAKCFLAQKSPSFFFPSRHDIADPHTAKMSIDSLEKERANYCHGIGDNRPCPVMMACREHAIAIRDWEGVRGGMTGMERFNLKRKSNRTKISA